MPFSNEHVREIAASLAERFLNSERFELKLIEGRGEVNQVYELWTSDKKAILRINDNSELARYQKEQWCIEKAREKNVPTPKILHVGHDHNIAFMLLDFVEGKNGQMISDTNDTWYALGKILRHIHSIPAQGFGDTLTDITTGNSMQWEAYLHDNIRALDGENVFEDRGLLNRAQVTMVHGLLKKLLGVNFSFGLNHGDYSLANVIIDKNAEPHIIDWGSAEAHVVPHHDLAVILEESLNEDSEKYAALLSGYGMVRQDYERISHEVRLLQLLDAVDKVRWAIDKAPQRLAHHAARLQKFVAKAAS